jgi:hypothetical protein
LSAQAQHSLHSLEVLKGKIVYDLWLTKGISDDCITEELKQEFPDIVTVQFLQRLQNFSPGFLDLNIPLVKAKHLLASITRCRARGLVILADYRSPKLSLEEALKIAKDFIAGYKNRAIPKYTVLETDFLREHAMWWTFGASVVEFVDANKIPSALLVSIDKLDGHIWQSEEMEHALEMAMFTS